MPLELDIDLDSVCRICVTGSTKKLTNIFINTIVDGYMISIPDIIQNCLDIKIEKNDPLPQKICADCKLEVVRYYTFKDKSKRTEQLLYKTLNIDREIIKPLSPISITQTLPSTLPNVDPLANFNETNEKITKFNIELKNEPQTDEEFDTIDDDSLNNVADELLEILNENSVELTITHEPEGNEDEEYNQQSIDDDHNDDNADNNDDEDEDDDNSTSKQINYEDKLELMEILGDSISEINEKNDSNKLIKSNQFVKTEQQNENNEFDEFVEQCVIEYPEYLCKFCNKTFENTKNLDNHIELCLNKEKINENDLSTNCDDDSQTNIEELMDLDVCNDEIKLKQIKSDKNNDSQILYSQENYIDGDDFDNFHTHEINITNELNNYDDNNENSDILMTLKPRINCDKCSAKFRSKTTYEQHLKRHDQLFILNTFISTYSCQKCHWIFVVQSDYENHMEKIHNIFDHHNINDNNLTTTTTTSGQLDSNDEYTDYQYLAEDDDYDSSIQHICGQCEITFPNCVQAKFHVVKHIKEFLCPYANCGCVYDTFQRFLFHIENRHIQFDLDECKHCGMKCENYDKLQYHVKNDCVQRKFACSHCDRKFLSKNALGTHLKSIQGKTNHCTICPKSFATTGELSLHMRSHTNDRPYVCTICYKSYKTSSMRRAHMDAHINGKTFACTICDKKLQTRTCFRNHMKRHTQEKKHPCTLCARSFFTKYHLKLHASKIHPTAVVT